MFENLPFPVEAFLSDPLFCSLGFSVPVSHSASHDLDYHEAKVLRSESMECQDYIFGWLVFFKRSLCFNKKQGFDQDFVES